MADVARLLVLVAGSALGAGWVRQAAWNTREWRQGRREGFHRSRAGWKAVQCCAQIGFLAQALAQLVLRWGSPPSLYLPLNVVFVSAGLLATWHLVYRPRHRREPR